MPAIFTVDPRSGVPIYLQLVDQIKRSVALGVLSGGEQLPTVKAMATDLTINPNTVARAYRDLERERVIETSPGRGSFVRASQESATPNQTVTDVVESALGEAIREARSMGLSQKELRAVIDRVVQRWYASDQEAPSS